MMASSIKKLSECPVCFVEMVPPMKIFQCINGHSLCENCKDNENVTTCPSCRVTLKRELISRNILAESLIEAVTKDGHNDKEDLIPSAPSMESVNGIDSMEGMPSMESINEEWEDENTPATYHFTDLLNDDCIVITSTGPAAQQKGIAKLEYLSFFSSFRKTLNFRCMYGDLQESR